MKSVIESINNIKDTKTLKGLQVIEDTLFEEIRKVDLPEKSREELYEVVETLIDCTKDRMRSIILNDNK